MGFLCNKCAQMLPLRVGRDLANHREWYCSKCGTMYEALFDIEADEDIWPNVQTLPCDGELEGSERGATRPPA
jgi:hypothetical protein